MIRALLQALVKIGSVKLKEVKIAAVQKLIQLGKVNPNDLLTQSSIDDTLHLIKELVL